MIPKNKTLATEFILLGFTKDFNINTSLFVLFFLIYLVTCVGNVLIISIIIINIRLHTPMYFFICNLSFIDLCFSSAAVPKLLIDLLSVQRIISFGACIFQVYCTLILGGTECLLLAFMAYDRYVAICRPLYYKVILSWRTCYLLTINAWIGCFIITTLPSLLMCDVLGIIKLFCVANFWSEILTFLLSLILLLLPFILILVSYIYIILSVLKVDSIGRAKAFSTCTSHLTVVALFYGTAMMIHTGSLSAGLSNMNKYISLFYVIITPMLNPLIYGLKNNEVKETLKNLFFKTS